MIADESRLSALRLEAREKLIVEPPLVRLEVISRKPEKYRLVDLETGEVWKYSGDTDLTWTSDDQMAERLKLTHDPS